MPKSCVIISSRPVPLKLRSLIPAGAYTIAADAGWRQAKALGVVPDLVLGDFDSAPPPAGAAEILRLPTEKDVTDTYFAVDHALERGFTDILLLGALGGRRDHTMANLQTLLHLAKRGARGLLADEHTEIRCTGPGQLRVKARPNAYLSVFAAGGIARGVRLGGVKYPLANATLTPDFPLGVSNEFVADEALVECTEGYLYIMTADRD